MRGAPTTLHVEHTADGPLAAADVTCSGEIVEVVVVDGGSTDGSKLLCLELGVRVVEGGSAGCRCRADALNLGAQLTSAPVLLFLHADTILPAGYM